MSVLWCAKSHIENPKGPLHSLHDDGGCYDRPHRHPLAVRSYSQPSWNRDQLTGGLVHHRSRLRCSWSGCVRSCTDLEKVSSLSLSRLQHVVAADLYFSDRLRGPLISFTAERLEQTESPMLIQVIVAASLAAAVVLALRNLQLV